MLGDLVESMKTAALEAVENSNPSCIMYGKVINTAPLQIQVNMKLILEENQLVLTRNVTDYTIDVTPQSWGTSIAVQNPDDMGMMHIFGNPETGGTNHGHSISGRKKLTIHNGLTVGEEVILIRQAGGQEYIVFDRVG